MVINTKVLVIADEDSEKTRILGYGTDEFSLKLMSPENIAIKLIILYNNEEDINYTKLVLLSKFHNFVKGLNNVKNGKR
jgi:hypothetical protein